MTIKTKYFLQYFSFFTFILTTLSVKSENFYVYQGNDVTINVSSYLTDEKGGRVGAICYNFSTNEKVSVSHIPVSLGNVTISCVQDLGMTEPSPGDEFRIVIVGDSGLFSSKISNKLIEQREIAAFVTGLSDIRLTDCWNRDTDDRRTLKGTASDVMDCQGIDVGFGYPNSRSYHSSSQRISIGFSGTVSDSLDPVVCPCFSQNRLDNFRDFSRINNTPECREIVDSQGTYIDANFPSNSSLFSVNVIDSNGLPSIYCAASSNGVGNKIVSDRRFNLTEEQFSDCSNIINSYCD